MTPEIPLIKSVVNSVETLLTPTEHSDILHNYCEQCRKIEEINIKILIEQAPAVLTIKFTNFSTYTHVLELSDIATQKVIYELVAAIVPAQIEHFSEYITYVRTSEKMWSKIFKSNVTTIEPQKVCLNCI